MYALNRGGLGTAPLFEHTICEKVSPDVDKDGNIVISKRILDIRHETEFLANKIINASGYLDGYMVTTKDHASLQEGRLEYDVLSIVEITIENKKHIILLWPGDEYQIDSINPEYILRSKLVNSEQIDIELVKDGAVETLKKGDVRNLDDSQIEIQNVHCAISYNRCISLIIASLKAPFDDIQKLRIHLVLAQKVLASIADFDSEALKEIKESFERFFDRLEAQLSVCSFEKTLDLFIAYDEMVNLYYEASCKRSFEISVNQKTFSQIAQSCLAEAYYRFRTDIIDHNNKAPYKSDAFIFVAKYELTLLALGLISDQEIEHLKESQKRPIQNEQEEIRKKRTKGLSSEEVMKYSRNKACLECIDTMNTQNTLETLRNLVLAQNFSGIARIQKEKFNKYYGDLPLHIIFKTQEEFKEYKKHHQGINHQTTIGEFLSRKPNFYHAA